MTQDMKKNTILHKIGQLIVPLKRTVSPLEADSHSAPGGHFFNRSLLLLLLLLTLGINVAWGEDYSGTYYLANNNLKNSVYDYKGYNNPDNFYLRSSTLNWNDDSDTPFLTTFKTGQTDVALWIVEKVGETNFYTFRQKVGDVYKYLTVNNAVVSKKHRRRVHLEEVTTVTDKNYFTIELIVTQDGIRGYTIGLGNEAYLDGTTNKYLNPAGGNYNQLDANGNDSGGIIGFYTKGDLTSDASGSIWFFEVPKPVIHINGNKLSFSCINEDVTYHYTIDDNDNDPIATDTNIYDESADNTLSEGVHTIKVIAVMNSGNQGYASGVVTQEVKVIGTTNSYLIQSKESPFYYLIPNLKNGNTDYPKNLTTLNVPCSTMVWTFEDAADNDGQYYYIKNSQGGYLYYTDTDNSDNKYVFFNADKNTSDDGYKFSIISHTSGGFNIIPKGQATPINKPSITVNNNDIRLSPVKLTGELSDVTSRWDFIRYTSTASLPQWTDVPFIESSNEVTHYYQIKNVNKPAEPLLLNNSGVIQSITVPAADYDVRKAMWVIKKVDAYHATDNPTGDDSELLDYYTFQNAYTGELLYLNKMEKEVKTDASPGMLQMGIPEGADETWSHFVIVQTLNNGYNIIPRVLVDNTKAIKTGTTHEAFNCINRANGKNYTGTWYDNDSGSRWTFAEQTDVPCMEPVFTEESNGDITITSVTNGAKIRYTVDDLNDPTGSSAEYTTKENASAQKVIKAIAIMGNDASTASNVVTLLNKPNIILTEGGNTVTDETYTYNGTAKEPVVSEVSIGESPNKTTATADTDFETVISTDYSDNTNAGTAKVTLRDKESNVFVWHAEKEFIINRASVTVTAENKSKEYGTADPELTATVEGVVSGQESLINYTISRAEGENVGGTYAITSTGAATQGNYSVTYVPGTLTITAKAVTVTADNKTKTYGDADPTLSVTIEGLVNNDPESVISYTISRAEGENVDTYTITPTGEASQGNYTVTYPTGTLTISKRPVRIISGLTANDKTYDGTTNATLVMTGAIFGEGDIITGDDLTIDSATGTFDTKDVGTNKTVTISSLNLVGDDAGNYELASSGNQTTMTASITRAPLSVTANDKIIGYGDAPDNDGVLYVGFVNNETVADLGDDALIYSYNSADNGSGTAYTSTSPVGTYYIIPSGLTSGNYDITFVPGTLTVNPKAIGDGTDPVEGFSISVGIGSENSFVVKNGETTLSLGDDYDVNTVSTSGKYSTIQIQGKGNYANQFVIRKAKVDFSNDGQSGTEYSATFVAEGNHALPTAEGITAYIIESISGNEVIATPLDYIPDGVPVLLLTDANVEGFVVNTPTSYTAITQEQEEANKLIVASGDDGARTFASTQIYLLYYDEFVLNKAGTLDAGKVYMSNPNYSTPTPSPARLKISRGGNTGIENIEYTIKPQSDAWYTLDGRRLSSKPTKKGIYLQGGKKIVVK